MRSVFNPGEKLEETLFFQTGEEFCVGIQALDLLSAHLPSGSLRILETEEEPLRDHCDILKADMIAGLSRLRRGYGETEFLPPDALVIDQALGYLANRSAENLTEQEQKCFLRYAEAARAILKDTVVEGWAFDVPAEVPSNQ